MNFSNSPWIVVTGAAGFLGRYIVAELATEGWSVIGVDQVSLPREDDQRGQVVEWCETTLPSEKLAQLLIQRHPRALVHAAGPASVPASITNPSVDFDGNVPLFFHVLDSVRRYASGCRVILLSSAAVYGNPTELPVSENMPRHPISPYGFHKSLCEQLADEFRQVYELQICAVRIFSAYGSGLRRQVLWDICQRAIHEPAIELWGSGKETRDFIHAHDVARAIALLLKIGTSDPVLNVATGKETTVAQLAALLCSALGVSKEIRFNGAVRQGDPMRWRADLTRLVALGYQPQIAIADGAARYARWVLEEERKRVT